MAGKDVDIAELNRRLRESNEALEVEKQKVESLEIDLDAEKLKSESAEEARKVTQAYLDVAQDNYAEVANSVLNSIELDRAVVALIVASRHAGHRESYIECTTHVESALNVQWGTRHCSVNEEAEKSLRQAEEITTTFPCLSWTWSRRHSNMMIMLHA
ncbi:hypothetical protein HanPI659440_Chr03g0109661 [Helianthus annuus]|nr:hypothetical protein HanPI659440_Chr03g0109661 [Helianthus annuus]